MGLPGDICKLKHEKEMCEGWDESECHKEAEYRLTGETDSFGSEYSYLCKEHLDMYKKARDSSNHLDICDHCNTEDKLYPTRDIEEGQGGPVYWLCSSCRNKESKRVNELYNELD